MTKELVIPILGMVITIISCLVLVIRFSRETKDRQKLEIDRQEKEIHEAEIKGIEEGRRRECDERIKLSVDSAHNKIRALESTFVMERQRQSEQAIEINAKLDNLMALVTRIEHDIVGKVSDAAARITRLEDI